jgi:hypothetical protein
LKAQKEKLMKQENLFTKAGTKADTIRSEGQKLTPHSDRMSEIRSDVSRIVSDMQNDFNKLGINSASEFLEAARQQGGQ